MGLTYKRIGQYYKDNGTLNYKINGISLPFPIDQAVKIEPWDLTNVFFNYTIKTASRLRGTKLQLAVNNLANNHSIVSVTPAIGATPAVRYVRDGGDFVTLLPGRSVTITVTGGWAPRR